MRACVLCVCVCVVRVCSRTCAEPLSHLQAQQRELEERQQRARAEGAREERERQQREQEERERRALEVGQRRREERERRETEQRASVPVCMCYASLVHVHRKMWTQSVKYGNTHIHTCVFLCSRVYVCTYVFVHILFVLTKPPIPSSPCNDIANLRPSLFYITRELTQGSPHVTNLNCFFNMICIMRELTQGSPCHHIVYQAL